MSVYTDMMKNNWFEKRNISKSTFVETCKNSPTMAIAASTLGLHFNTLKRVAQELDCYEPNQGGRGITKPKENGKIPLSEILAGEHPSYQTFKLKKRLIKEGVKENKCEKCGLRDWQNLPLNMELHHINGDRTDHQLENLKMICPNCHAQTSTFRALNIHAGMAELADARDLNI